VVRRSVAKAHMMYWCCQQHVMSLSHMAVAVGNIFTVFAICSFPPRAPACSSTYTTSAALGAQLERVELPHSATQHSLGTAQGLPVHVIPLTHPAPCCPSAPQCAAVELKVHYKWRPEVHVYYLDGAVLLMNDQGALLEAVAWNHQSST